MRRGVSQALWEWALPAFENKQRLTWSKLWILAAPLPLLLLQIHLLLRYDTRRSWLYRCSLIPLITLLAVRAGFSHYASLDQAGQLDGGMQHVNMTFAIFSVFVIVCSLRWGFTLTRPRLSIASSKQNGNGDADVPMPIFFPGTWVPLEIDYFGNLRGLGWADGLKNSAPALPLPVPLPLSKRIAWILGRLAVLAANVTLVDVIFVFIKDAQFNPSAASLTGGSIWDCQDGPLGLAGPYILCACYAFGLYANIQAGDCAASVIGVGFFGQPPERWGPLPFSAPWLATSLQQLWSDRWHQLFRLTFLNLAYRPTYRVLRPLTGRNVAKAVAILAVFTLSGLMHDAGQMAMTAEQRFSLTSTTLFFVLQGVATIAEQAWQSATGYQVRGIGGWLWTMSWSLLTAPLLIESWNTRGLLSACDISLGHTRAYVTPVLDHWYSVASHK